MIRAFIVALLLGATSAAHAQTPPVPSGQTNVNGNMLTGTVANCWDSVALSVVACPARPVVSGNTGPSLRTIIPLDISTITTGGVAVTALSAGHRTAGGWLQNPSSATVNLCISEQGTATGTTSAGATTCIVPGQTYALTPAAGAVSVIAADSAHPFSGQGYN